MLFWLFETPTESTRFLTPEVLKSPCFFSMISEVYAIQSTTWEHQPLPSSYPESQVLVKRLGVASDFVQKAGNIVKPERRVADSGSLLHIV